MNISSFFKLHRKQPLSREAFSAYLNRLPSKITVHWFRDDSFIVGDIQADNKHLMTQGKSVEEFIDMVNDALYTAYEIPEEYKAAVAGTRLFRPNDEQLSKLNDIGVREATFGSRKEKGIMKLA